MGGISRRATDFGNLALTALTDHCRRSGRSHAVIFVDITATFYHLRRRYLAPDGNLLSS